MNIRFLTLAQQEIDDAFVWFEAQSEGKGIAFLDDLDSVVRRVKAYPLASTEIEPDIRRCRFARFRYSLIYGIEDQTIVVIAVTHSHRAPRYWLDRLVSE